MTTSTSTTTRVAAAVVGLVVAPLALAACSGDDGGGASGGSGGAEPTSATPTPAPQPPEAPRAGDCYGLSYAQAVSPTHNREPVDCGQSHTSETYDVGELDTVVDGHLVAVDSARAQEQVSTDCPAGLSGFLGGDLAAQRLSMLQAVWFTPSLRQAARGADWYRCDVVALEGPEQLREVEGSLEGVLATPAGRSAYAMCGTAAPDDPAFERVSCASEHSWRAVSVVTYEAQAYPGEEAAQARGQVPCEDAGAAAADDPLDYEWGFEFPTAEQWEAGMTFGRCWVPD